MIALREWPQPAAGTPEPHIFASDSALAVRFEAADGKTAVVSFPHLLWFCLGLPNDEALDGHPLHARGLKPYCIHEVRNSTRVAELERQNAVHPRHDARRFLETARHYIITFHDSTLECVAAVMPGQAPEARVFENPVEATAYWQHQPQWGISWE